MVLGLAYIFFFNEPGNPLNGSTGTMAILVHLHGRRTSIRSRTSPR